MSMLLIVPIEREIEELVEQLMKKGFFLERVKGSADYRKKIFTTVYFFNGLIITKYQNIDDPMFTRYIVVKGRAARTFRFFEELEKIHQVPLIFIF